MLFRILLACVIVAIPVGVVLFPVLGPVLSGNPVLVDPPLVAVSSSSVAPVGAMAGASDQKPTILIFTAEWCGPCQVMKKKVYPSPEVAEVADRFHWVFVDVDKNKETAAQYGARSIPHFVIQSVSGETVGTLTGGRDPQSFKEFLLTAL